MSEEIHNSVNVYPVSSHGGNGMVILNDRGLSCDGYVLYRRVGDKYCVIFLVYVNDDHKDMTDKIIKIACEDIVESGYVPLPKCEEARAWYEKAIAASSKKDTIMEVEPNFADGSKKFREDDTTCYDLFIEYPVREACKRLLEEKGIRTIMSSANKEDAERAGTKEKEGEQLFIGPNQHFNIGNGYAWIMFDFDELTSDNKDIVIGLNKGDIPIELSEEAKKRFEKNCVSNGVSIDQGELVKFYRVIHQSCSYLAQRWETPFESRPRNPYFEARQNILINNNSLACHGKDYDAVVLRYPIDESTSVDEIIGYYNRVIDLFKDKEKVKK